MEKFEVGKRYEMRSACDQNCVWRYKVSGRSEKTITLQKIDNNGKVSPVKVHYRINKRDTEYFGAEAVRPLGTYSMCPILRATEVINS